jgi:hypothetical protein
MLRVRLDGLDDQIEFVGAVDFAGNAVIAMRQYLLGFGEVVKPINAMRGVIFHDKHDARAVFRPRDQSEMVGAEVEHGTVRAGSPAPPVAPLRGYPADSSVRDITTVRRLLEAGTQSAGGFGFLLVLRRLSPPSKKISEFSTKRSAIAVAIVVL